MQTLVALYCLGKIRLGAQSGGALSRAFLLSVVFLTVA